MNIVYKKLTENELDVFIEMRILHGYVQYATNQAKDTGRKICALDVIKS